MNRISQSRKKAPVFPLMVANIFLTSVPFIYMMELPPFPLLTIKIPHQKRTFSSLKLSFCNVDKIKNAIKENYNNFLEKRK